MTFDPFDIKIYGYGCRWSRFEDRAVFDGKAAAAQADGSFTVRIKRGDPSRSIRLDGVDGAPRVRVSAPDGQVLESAAKGMALTPALRILSLEKVKQTVVGLFEPKPGIYKIDLLPGSPRIAKVSESEDPGPPRVSVRVRGTGARRTLEYDVARRDDQKVTFVEVAAGGKRPTRHRHRRAREAQLHACPGYRPAAHRGAVRARGHRRRDADRRGVLAAVPAPRPARPGHRPPQRHPPARALDARRAGGALRGRHDAGRRRAADHPHPPPERHAVGRVRLVSAARCA